MHLTKHHPPCARVAKACNPVFRIRHPTALTADHHDVSRSLHRDLTQGFPRPATITHCQTRRFALRVAQGGVSAQEFSVFPFWRDGTRRLRGTVGSVARSKNCRLIVDIAGFIRWMAQVILVWNAMMRAIKSVIGEGCPTGAALPWPTRATARTRRPFPANHPPGASPGAVSRRGPSERTCQKRCLSTPPIPRKLAWSWLTETRLKSSTLKH